MTASRPTLIWDYCYLGENLSPKHKTCVEDYDEQYSFRKTEKEV